METRPIGSLNVSVVGLGCNNFGGRIDIDATKSVVDAAIESGINFFDTADIYGGTKSEEFIGQVLAGRRDAIILATKFGIKLDDARPGGAGAAYIKSAVEDSLKRLAMDHIDLYQIHRPDTNTPIAETLGALNELVVAGKVREIGCSNFSQAQLKEAKAASEAGGFAKFVSVQNEYSLMKRAPESDGVLEECAAESLGFLPYFPLASGLLSGKYRKGQPFPEGTRLNGNGKTSDSLSDANLDLIEKLATFAEARGHTILELAFSWLLRQKTVASVIAGATKPEQIYANAKASGWVLTDSELAEVTVILAA